MHTTHADPTPSRTSRPPGRWHDQPWVWVLAGGVIMGLALGILMSVARAQRQEPAKARAPL